MEKTKTSFKTYSAWNYQKEIEDLNLASENGWQLVKGGCFSSRFVENHDVRYIYQMDFGKVPEMGRYLETFREQGWEYINSTFNGWHYFRKPYDPTLPEEEYKIFTDRESLHEMNNRWARLAFGIGIVIALFAIVDLVRLILHPQLPVLVQFLTLAIESAVLIRGFLIMRDPDAKRSRKGDSLFLGIFFTVIIVGCFVSIRLTDDRPHFSTSSRASSIDEPFEDEGWSFFTIRYKDNYFMDLKIEGEDPVTVKLVDKDGQIIYTNTGTSVEENNIKLKLPKGQYEVLLSAESGYQVECKID